MKIKAKEIADALNLSTATVSLALNHKPGVSQKTKDEIFSYIHTIEKQERQVIKMIICHAKEEDTILHYLGDETLQSIDQTLKSTHYDLMVEYFDLENDDFNSLLTRCHQKEVAGVFLQATRLNEKELIQFQSIQKPMVVYDCKTNIPFHYFTLDNQEAVRLGHEYFMNLGCKNVLYLDSDTPFYNHLQRKEAILTLKKDIHYDILSVSLVLEKIEIGIKNYFKNNGIPKAIFSSSVTCSIALLKVLKEENINLKNMILVGIDEIPEYLADSKEMICIKVSHRQRSMLAVQHLLLMIEKKMEFPVHMQVAPILIKKT